MNTRRPLQGSVRIFTIISTNYLAYSKTLFEGISSNSGISFSVFIVDRPFDPSVKIPGVELIWIESLGLSHFHDMAIRYDVTELNTAVKPSAFRHLFARNDEEIVMYLDPDTRVFDLDGLLDAVLPICRSICLTPHVLEPVSPSSKPDERQILMSGTFNLGFICARRSPNAEMFLSWWEEKTRTGAVSDIANGLFTDQKWCDLAPSFISDLGICRHPGVNVAYWNLEQRRVNRTADGRWRAQDGPLLMFHYSGFDAFDQNRLSRHHDGLRGNDLDELRPLLEDYGAMLRANGLEETGRREYGFSRLGATSLSSSMRQAYRDAFPDGPPPSEIDESQLLAICNLPASSDCMGVTGRITRLMAAIYLRDTRLMRRFPLRTFLGRWRFMWWFARRGAARYNLPEVLVRQDLIRESATAAPSCLKLAELPHVSSMGLKQWMRKLWRASAGWPK